MGPPIRIQQVWKSYGSVEAVRGLDLTVPPQSVFGFLGPNGAGKSTTIGLILGLLRPTRGTIALFDQDLDNNRSVLGRIGSLVESPSLYPHLTGRENLEVHRRLLGLSTRAIEDVLENVGLMSASSRLVRQYSFGMKQRLGLAQALLGGPELLLLDEPTNGLDPAGIYEVRALIRDLPRRCGVTVFLSSHLLSEVEQVATDLAIVSKGELKFSGTTAELRTRSKQAVVLKVDQPQRAIELLVGLCRDLRREGDQLSVAPEDGIDAARLNAMLVGAGIRVSHLMTQHMTLEDVFLELTGPANAGGAV
ncbi:MAG: ATP-binding cassette domain-containing protein [Bryobacterales bacterium]|nr:ATP-binding cassette domain-containing protein [Bryobacterales bacterium]